MVSIYYALHIYMAGLHCESKYLMVSPSFMVLSLIVFQVV